MQNNIPVGGIPVPMQNNIPVGGIPVPTMPRIYPVKGPKMTYIIPDKEVTPDSARAFRKLCVDNMVYRAMSIGLVKNQDELTIKDVLPQDLGVKDWTVHSGQFIVHKISNRQIVAIYKFIQQATDPTATTIEFIRGTQPIGKYSLDALYDGNKNTNFSGWLTEPHIYDPDDIVKINLEFTRFDYNYLVMVGLVGEPRK